MKNTTASSSRNLVQRRSRLLPILGGSILALCAAVPLATAGEPVFGLGAGGITIRRFDSATPAALGAAINITGLQAGETLRGIDFRPGTVRLFGVSSQNRLYSISLANGGAAATQVGANGAFVLSGATFGVDFNPVPDRLRVVSDLDQNLRLNPNDGTLSGTDTNLAYAVGDPNAAANPNVVAVAYTNNFAGAATTTLYGVDSNLDILVTQNPPNNGTLNTVGPLGFNAGAGTGLDISGLSGTAFLSDGATSFRTVNLATGAATAAGVLGAALDDIAVLPATSLYWDVNPAVAGLGGTGNWDVGAAATNWTFDAAGTGPNFTWPNTLMSDAVFAGTAGTVTVTSALQVRNVNFDVNGYTIAGAQPITLVPGGVMTVTNLADRALISAPLAGAGPLVKAGPGELVLTSNTSSYTGGTTLNTGRLLANANNALGTGTVTINGGTIGSEVNNTTLPNALSVQADFAIATPVGANAVNFNGNVDLGAVPRVISIVGSTGSSANFAGIISGTGGVTFSGGPGITFVTFTDGVGATPNTYTGLTTVNSTAVLVLDKDTDNTAVLGDLTLNPSSRAQLSSSDQIADTATVTVNSTGIGGGAGLVLNGYNETIATLLGNGTVQLDDGFPTTAGALTVGAGDFGGVISDRGIGGRLIKNTAGTLVLRGANTYVGDTTVNLGSLIVDGSTASRNTFVNPGGLLGGHGVIGGNVFNDGVVSPGNSPGTLRVSGNYYQASGGTLVIELAGKSAGQFDVLRVGGQANLDGTLRLVNVGNVRLKRGDKLAIVTAGDGVEGEFAHITGDAFSPSGKLLRAGVVYDDDVVYLTAIQGSFANDLGSLTPNQRAVAHTLDGVFHNRRADRIIDFLNDRPLGELRHDLDLIAPEELASIFHIGISLAKVQSANIQRRAGDIRDGSTGFSSSGYALEESRPADTGGGTVYGRGARGSEGKGGKEMLAPSESRWGVFVTGAGEFTNVGDTSNARGYNLTTGGFTLGADYKITPNFALGISGGYASTHADLTNNGRVSVDGARAGIYATYFTGTGFYADLAASGGYNSYDTQRRGLRGRARGSTEGGEFDGLLAAGYDWKIGGLTVGPTASVSYTTIEIDEFREHGSLAPLKFTNQNEQSLRTTAGLKASYDWHAGSVIIRPEVRAAWQHEFADSAFGIESRLASGAGGGFTVRGPAIGDDSLLLGAGVAVLWNERTSTYVYYDGELARSNYDSHNVSGGLRLSF